jgi:hypothetical protein
MLQRHHLNTTLQFSHNCLSWQVCFWDVYSIVLRCLSLQTSQLQPARGGSCIKTATRVDVVPLPRTKWTQLLFVSCDVSGVCTFAAVAVEGRPLAAYAARAVRGDPAAASKPLPHLVQWHAPPHARTRAHAHITHTHMHVYTSLLWNQNRNGSWTMYSTPSPTGEFLHTLLLTNTCAGLQTSTALCKTPSPTGVCI